MEGEETLEIALPSAASLLRCLPATSPCHLSLSTTKQPSLTNQLLDPSMVSLPSSESSLSAVYNKALRSIAEEEITLPLSRSDLRMGRDSPISVDSGFESSFPSSPDSSSGEGRNLLMHKLEPSSILSINVENDCKSKIESVCRASVIRMAPPATIRSESPPDITNDLPDVVHNSEARDSDALSLGKPIKIPYKDSVQKLHLDISSLSVVKPPNPGYVHEVCSRNANPMESESLSVDEKGDCCADVVRHSTVKAEEFCEFPSTSVASSSNYTPSTPQSVKDNEEFDSVCLWDHCGQQFNTEMDLFEHVMQSHFECLDPLEDANTVKRNRNGTKARSKNLLCKWDSCEMGLSRGDLKKQFVWLREHFLTRHFRKAKPYCCLIDGCSARFSFKRALEDHLQTGHDKVKRTDVGRKKKPKVESCLEWTPLPYYPPDPKNDFLDKATIEFMVMRLRKYERIEHPQFVPRPPPGPRGGAAYRKRKRILTWDIIPFEEFYKQEVERKRSEIANGVPQVGEFAAKEWKRIFSQVT